MPFVEAYPLWSVIHPRAGPFFFNMLLQQRDHDGSPFACLPLVVEPYFEAVGALEHCPWLQPGAGDPENRVVRGDCVDDTFAHDEASAAHLDSLADDSAPGVVDTQGHRVFSVVGGVMSLDP
ncbi:hypothetical protein SB659_17385 [Arthrobacter sp. SIMBA_036]|uniref:hypothetical protein n=1 Tax=Arthrobacter sp. SIMBA_036 TaxID=3085778 RepID=UPI00397D8174